MLKHGLLAGMLLALTGCTVGPNYERPKTVADDLPGFVHARKEMASVPVNDPNLAWWEHFGDPVTAELVRAALEQNTDLQAQAARVLQSEALLAQSQAAAWPQVDLTYAGDRTSRSFVLPAPVGRVRTKATTQNPALEISYIADLFGRIRRANEADQAAWLERRANHKALQHSIIAQVVRTRVLIATLERQLEIARNNTKNWQTSLDIAQRRYEEGIIGPLAVHVARENVSRSQSVEPALELSLQQTYHALDVLLGRAPGTTPALPATLTELPDLTPVPVDLPAALLDRRPDIREAEHRLHAATARVGVSVARLLPDVNLAAQFGYTADKGSTLFLDNSYVYSLILQATQPIFHGGQLQAQVHQAEAVVKEEAALYSGTILRALKEVEDALVSEQKLWEQFEAVKVRYEAALASERLAQNRYLEGVEQLATVLETERSRREAEDQLTALKGEIWNARIDLLLALGGDWNLQEADETSSVTKSQGTGMNNEG